LTSSVFVRKFEQTKKSSMETNKTWRINGTEFPALEMKTIACLMLGLTRQEVGECLCKSEASVKGYLIKIYDKTRLRKMSSVLLAMHEAGFDRKGCFKGEQMLSAEEMERAKSMLPPAL
jgi:DNA-binding NarL/FixJ family response regulator